MITFAELGIVLILITLNQLQAERIQSVELLQETRLYNVSEAMSFQKKTHTKTHAEIVSAKRVGFMQLTDTT